MYLTFGSPHIDDFSGNVFNVGPLLPDIMLHEIILYLPPGDSPSPQKEVSSGNRKTEATTKEKDLSDDTITKNTSTRGTLRTIYFEPTKKHVALLIIP